MPVLQVIFMTCVVNVLRGPLLLENLEQHVDLTRPLETVLEVDHLIGYDAEAPVVHSEGVLLVAEEDLRSAVPHGLHLLSHGLHGVADNSAQAEVSDLHLLILSEEDVCRLEISVYEHLVVEERLGQFTL